MFFRIKKVAVSVLAIIISLVFLLMSGLQASAEEHTHILSQNKFYRETFEESYRYYGDLNADGVVSVLDVVIMQRKVAGLIQFKYETWREDFCVSDLNNDAQVNMEDVVLCQRRIALLIKRFPVGVLFHKLR